MNQVGSSKIYSSPVSVPFCTICVAFNSSSDLNRPVCKSGIFSLDSYSVCPLLLGCYIVDPRNSLK